MRTGEGKELLRFVDGYYRRDKGGSKTVGVYAAAASVGNPGRGDRVQAALSAWHAQWV
jgi:hypothetical protein